MANKDKDSNWGGAREGPGRKSLGEKLKLAEMLDTHIDPNLVMQRLEERIDSGDHRAIELYLKYRAGLPTQKVDMDVSGSQDVNITLRNLINFKEEE